MHMCTPLHTYLPRLNVDCKINIIVQVLQTYTNHEREISPQETIVQGPCLRTLPYSRSFMKITTG